MHFISVAYRNLPAYFTLPLLRVDFFVGNPFDALPLSFTVVGLLCSSSTCIVSSFPSPFSSSSVPRSTESLPACPPPGTDTSAKRELRVPFDVRLLRPDGVPQAEAGDERGSEDCMSMRGCRKGSRFNYRPYHLPYYTSLLLFHPQQIDWKAGVVMKAAMRSHRALVFARRLGPGSRRRVEQIHKWTLWPLHFLLRGDCRCCLPVLDERQRLQVGYQEWVDPVV